MPAFLETIDNLKDINKGTLPHDLPPNMWSDGNNVTFSNNRTEKVKGYAERFVDAGGVSDAEIVEENKDLEAARNRWKELTGKAPHPRKKLITLLTEIKEMNESKQQEEE